MADEAGLAARRLVGMNDPLGGRLVDPLDGHPQPLGSVVGAGLSGSKRVLGPRLQLGADSLVPVVPDLVLPISLDLTLDVRHVFSGTRIASARRCACGLHRSSDAAES